MNQESGSENAAVEAPKTDFVEADNAPEVAKEAPKVEEKPPAVVEEDSGEQAHDEAKKPKRGGFQKKISRLETENANLQARLAALEAGKSQAKAPEEASEPTPEQFSDWDSYNNALIDHRASKMLEKREAEQRQKAQQDALRSEMQTKVQRFEKQKEDMRAKYEDFDDVVDSFDGQVPPAMAMAIVESEMAGEIAYYLGNNPEEAHKMASMSLVEANRYIGRLESKLENQKAKPVEAKKTTDAPPPVSPVKSGAKSDHIDFENCTHEEYKAWRSRQRS